MFSKKDKKVLKNKYKRKKTQFNLQEVIIIMIITAICSITLAIKVSYTSNGTSKIIKSEAELHELINVYNSINEEYYEEVDSKELVNSAIEGMLDCLDDPYTKFLDEAESDSMAKELEGEFIGVGTDITLYSDGNFVITRVYNNSPAAKAGLKNKDIILKINNVDLSGKSLDDISSMLKLKAGTKVNMIIKRGTEDISITVEIGKVEIESVTYEVVNKNNKKVALVHISTFAKNSYEQFKKVIDDLQHQDINNIILDLRGNTGGHLAIAESIASMFLEKDDVIYQLKIKDTVDKIKNKNSKKINMNIVLLVNGTTASAAEILTATLKENLSIPVVGVKTYGKGKVQKLKKLSNGSFIKYTIQNWLTPNGEEIDEKGIEPTIEVKMVSEYYNNPNSENDNQYQTALDIISK